MEILIATEPDLGAEEFIDILNRSTLGQRRPVDQVSRIEKMLKSASLIVTARNEKGKLVGVSRAISDFSYCTYLSDLAVDETFQRLGIGKRLIATTHKLAGLGTHLILLAAPAAESYYPHIGMEKHDSCWLTRSNDG